VDRLIARLASRNPNKARELQRLLPGWSVEPLEVGEPPEETGATYLENARLKARFGRDVGPADAWILGEDSGIEVDGLGGAPGLRSARFGGAEPVARLLEELQDVSGDGRRARYVCELVALSPEGAELRGTGTLEGRIAEAPRGHEGFGYDPIFVPEGEGLTVAELGNDWKVEHSHRARAARALLDAIARQ
jgi:XTP/dITP diphosphohydrolase